MKNEPLSRVVPLSNSDTLKLALTTQEGRSAKRPHQAFLLLKDPETGLDISYPFIVKDNGKAKLEMVSRQPSNL
jgi:oligosaccharyltransferase complex subunit delta (ribophorin II)